MLLFIKVKPRAKQANVEQLDPNHFKIAVKEPPDKNKANVAVIKALAMFLHQPPASLKIIAGFTNRKKVVELQ